MDELMKGVSGEEVYGIDGYKTGSPRLESCCFTSILQSTHRITTQIRQGSRRQEPESWQKCAICSPTRKFNTRPLMASRDESSRSSQCGLVILRSSAHVAEDAIARPSNNVTRHYNNIVSTLAIYWSFYPIYD